MPAPKARSASAKTKVVNGRTVSARSKTGNAECSQAMSTWVRTRKEGTTPASVFAMLGKCRSMARAGKQATQHRAAGNEAKAQRYEALAAGKKGPISAKDRLARAKELRAELNAKRAGAGAAPVAAKVAPLRKPRDPEIVAARKKVADDIRSQYRTAEQNVLSNPDYHRQSPALSGGLKDIRKSTYRQDVKAGVEKAKSRLPLRTTVEERRLDDKTQIAIRTDAAGSAGYRRGLRSVLAPPASPSLKAPGRGTPERLEKARKLKAERAAKRVPSPAVAPSPSRPSLRQQAAENRAKQYGGIGPEIRQSTAEIIRDYRKGKSTTYVSSQGGGYGSKSTKEDIGTAIYAETKQKVSRVLEAGRQSPARPSLRQQADAARAARKPETIALERIGANGPRGGASAYVAAIKGPDPKYGAKREFMSGKRDYSNANSTRSRGVTETYTLHRGGVYEINEPRSWKNVDRYHIVARAKGLKKVSKERAIEIGARLEKFKARQAAKSVSPAPPAPPSLKALGRGTPDRLAAAQSARLMVKAGESRGKGLASKWDNLSGGEAKAYQSGIRRAEREAAATKAAKQAEIRKDPSYIASKRNARLAEVLRKRGIPLAAGDAKKLISSGAAVTTRIRDKYADRLKALRAERAAKRAPSPAAAPAVSRPSLKDQAAAHRASKGPEAYRAAGLGNKAAAKAYDANNRGEWATGNVHHARANRLQSFARANRDINADREFFARKSQPAPSPPPARPTLRQQADAHRAAKGISRRTDLAAELRERMGSGRVELRSSPPLVSQPASLGNRSVITAGGDRVSGKEYVLPGAEQYRVVAVGPSGSKRGGTKRQFSIYEASTGTLLEKDRYPTQPLTEGLAYTARNLANTPSDRVIASLNDAAASRRRTVRKAVLQDFRARRSSARA